MRTTAGQGQASVSVADRAPSGMVPLAPSQPCQVVTQDPSQAIKEPLWGNEPRTPIHHP